MPGIEERVDDPAEYEVSGAVREAGEGSERAEERVVGIRPGGGEIKKEKGRKMNDKLKIAYHKETEEIFILGDKKGLEFFSDCCLRVIGKDNPSGHFHLMPEMNNVSKGSIPTIIKYSDKPEDYE